MRVAIIGYGKMGREIERILLSRGHEVAAVVDAVGAVLHSVDELAGMDIDVALEFTTPATALGNIYKCMELGIPLVCGTTGWTAHLSEVEEMCRRTKGAFFWASNYSIGVNVAFELNRVLARLMNGYPEYDVTVEETHHVEKKDAPSGTAITLAEGIVAGLDRKSLDTLQVVSTRRGVAPGTHTVTYESGSDIITLRHDIKSRAGLAMGAVLAAEFLAARVAEGRHGVYTMRDLLQL